MSFGDAELQRGLEPHSQTPNRAIESIERNQRRKQWTPAEEQSSKFDPKHCSESDSKMGASSSRVSGPASDTSSSDSWSAIGFSSE